MQKKPRILNIFILVVIFLYNIFGQVVILNESDTSPYFIDNLFNNIENKRPIIKSAFSPEISNWKFNGIPICAVNNTQENYRICSDGNGGAIITWEDNRNATNTGIDIYAQKVNSTGHIQWIKDGIPICTADNDQEYPQICSDEQGGAIISWRDMRDEVDSNRRFDVYAQRINSTGGIEWDPNGKNICPNQYNQLQAQICSDRNGGAIIAWTDERANNGWGDDIYAQRINSNGNILWDYDGKVICDLESQQHALAMISTESGEAILVWADYRDPSNKDLYAQKIDLNGNKIWEVNGTAICQGEGDETSVVLCEDGNGGAFVAFIYDMFDLKVGVQKINSTGYVYWAPTGMPIYYPSTYDQDKPAMCSDGEGGAIIVWEDERNEGVSVYAQRIDEDGYKLWASSGIGIYTSGGTDINHNPKVCSAEMGGAIITFENNDDIFAQKINSNGNLQWDIEGTSICRVSSFQLNPEICPNGAGGAIIVWEDNRNGIEMRPDIYAQHIRSEIPSSNHPGNIYTYLDADERIHWILSDDIEGGEYRVIANDSEGDSYVWIDWTAWSSDFDLNVPINPIIGNYNYTIEYVDSHYQFGITDTVFITIIEDHIPFSNHPDDITTTKAGSERINWTLYDDIDGGKYRVIANDSNGNYYVYVNWTSWYSGEYYSYDLTIPINRGFSGIYNYIIEYYDSRDHYGIPDSVIVTIESETTEERIPYGSYYLVFLIIGIISIIIIQKRRERVIT